MIIQKKAKFAEVVALLMNSIDYNNFKAAANKDAYADGVLMDVYHAATRTLSNGGQTGFQFDSDFHHQDK